MDQGHVMPRPSRRMFAWLMAGGGLLALGATGCAYYDGGATARSGAQGFTVAVSPASLEVPAGGSGYAVVTVVRNSGFAGAVALSVAGLPAGVVVDGTIPAGATTGYLTATVDGSVSPRIWPSLTLEGQSGALASTAAFALTVQAPLAAMAYPVDRVNAGGGFASGGTWRNTAVCMEPVAHASGTSGSGAFVNQSGFLPDADPSQP